MESIESLLLALHARYASLDDGETASYIPELMRANPDHFALSLTTVDGRTTSVGDDAVEFSLQSISKPFVYGLALREIGRKRLLASVGVEPSGEAFNSIVELEKTTHRPYNPMINSGAIAITGLLSEKNPTSLIETIVTLLGDCAGRSAQNPLRIDRSVFQSEKATAHRNRSIAHLLRHFNVIGDAIESSLDCYFQQCSILADTRDLSMMAATLANGGVNPITKKIVLAPQHVRDVLSVMFTCGMYDSAGEWAFHVGLPAKSGVSGGLITVVPGVMGIATYSPRIDSKGHSLRGVRAITDLANELQLNVFTSTSSQVRELATPSHRPPSSP